MRYLTPIEVFSMFLLYFGNFLCKIIKNLSDKKSVLAYLLNISDAYFIISVSFKNSSLGRQILLNKTSVLYRQKIEVSFGFIRGSLHLFGLHVVTFSLFFKLQFASFHKAVSLDVGHSFTHTVFCKN